MLFHAFKQTWVFFHQPKWFTPNEMRYSNKRFCPQMFLFLKITEFQYFYLFGEIYLDFHRE